MSTALQPGFARGRAGAALIAAGIVQFCVAMAAVQAAYPGYSDLTNYISDLGNTATSPWHDVFNVSIVILGVLSFVGILLAWESFPRGGSRAVGLLLLMAASLGAIGVGLYPENVNGTVHGIASFVVFGPGGLALVVLGAGFRRAVGWRWLAAPSVVLGLIDLVALAYFAPTQVNNTTWDPGLIERFVVFPILIWGLLVAAQLLRGARSGAPATGAISG